MRKEDDAMKKVIITDKRALEKIVICLNTRGAYRLLREHLEALVAQQHDFSVQFVEIKDEEHDPCCDPL